ncbi:MAG TPA: DegV family EDD domain-containing protein [Bacteroidetes bacterium]|nr:DegV family EDD domain-containing protein [Bacteroidota bacterium]
MSVLPTHITRLNGTGLYYLFLAGAKKLFEHQEEINLINVYPVPDADTGTNLASTIRAVIDQLRPDKSFKNTADAIALAALTGARGNSGVIFAQFLYGMSAETAPEQEVTVSSFADSVKKAVNYVYDALSHPVEGTMLTVIREWAEYIHGRKEELKDFNEMLSRSLEVARESLKGTTEKLKELAMAQVVDAGAKGFVVFLEGIMEYVTDRNLKKVLQVSRDVVHLDAVHEVSHREITYRYCTEVMLRGENIDKNRVRELADASGDSVVIAGSGQVLRLHVHTNHPDTLVAGLRQYGRIAFQKADDMVRQYEMIHHRKSSVALVTDSTCDLPEVILDHYQIYNLPIQVEIAGSQYLDRLTIKPEQFYSLMQDKRSAPSTSQINETAFVQLYTRLLNYYDSVIAVHLSGHFSGTCHNSAKAARKVSHETGRKITVIDSKQISGGMGLGILKMARALEEGKSHEEVVHLGKRWFASARLFVGVRDIKYLVRSGRVSPLKGFIGKILNMKPIITVDPEGRAVQFGKTISQKGILKMILREIRKMMNEGGVDDYVVLQVRNPEMTGWFTAELKKITGRDPVSVVQVSPALALHAGVGTVAVALLKK